MLAKVHKNQESADRLIATSKELFPDKDFSYMIPEDDVLEGGFVPEYQKLCFYELEDLKYEDEFFNQAELNKLIPVVGLGTLYEERPDLWKEEYGVSDNFDQIREYFKEEIEDPDNSYVILVSRVDQHKENAGQGGGWRWHKWGEYIGTLEPEYEYLDDEDFGDDWQGYVITFHMVKVHPENFPELD